MPDRGRPRDATRHQSSMSVHVTAGSWAEYVVEGVQVTASTGETGNRRMRDSIRRPVPQRTCPAHIRLRPTTPRSFKPRTAHDQLRPFRPELGQISAHDRRGGRGGSSPCSSSWLVRCSESRARPMASTAPRLQSRPRPNNLYAEIPSAGRMSRHSNDSSRATIQSEPPVNWISWLKPRSCGRVSSSCR